MTGVITLIKSYKTEINPTLEQKQIIHKTIGVCRYVYNFYLSHNKEIYDAEKRFVSGREFSKWLNNTYLRENPDKSWIKEVSSKSVKQSIMNADAAFKKFFRQKSGFPKYKKKGISDVKMYFVKTDSKAVIRCERHRIKIPTLGWMRLKEKGYFPTNPDTHIIKSGTVSMKAGRYYVSILVEEPPQMPTGAFTDGIGIDLGLKSLLVSSNGIKKQNINQTKTIRKQLKRKQRCLSRKYEELKKRKKKGEATRQNIQKQKLKVQKLHQRIANIRTNYINQCVNELVKTKPAFITIEDLNISGMMKNRHLSKAIASQKFYEFRVKLEAKCKENGIELRIADRFYPSSKMCHHCGFVKKNLKLSDRIYRCTCGYIEDRDVNASLNLRDAIVYRIA